MRIRTPQRHLKLPPKTTWARRRARVGRLPRPAQVVVTFGPPLRFERVAGAGKKEYYDAVSREMMAAIARLQNT